MEIFVYLTNCHIKHLWQDIKIALRTSYHLKENIFLSHLKREINMKGIGKDNVT